MSKKVTSAAKLLITVVSADALGNPAPLKSIPVWTLSDPTMIPDFLVAPDGLSATGTAAKTGSVTVTAAADGLTGSEVIDVVAGDAVTLTLVVTTL